MKSVLISIRPQWCEKKVSGKKTIEVRKAATKEVPFKWYIYMTQGAYKDLGLYSEGIYQNRMKVIGEFICDKVDKIIPLRHTYYNHIGVPIENVIEYGIWNDDLPQMQMTKKEINDYGKGKTLFGWHISDLKIYDKPKELSEFRAYNFKSMNGTDVCGNYDCKYYQDSGSYMIPPSCAKNGCRITHPPQSWQYVEEKR